MINLIKDLPDNVVGLSAHGTVTEEDYRTVLVPAVEGALERHDKIRVYYEIEPDVRGFDVGAILADARIGVGRLFHWERIALVTDTEWIRNSVRLLGFLMPAEVRTFDANEAAAAKAWVCA